MTGSFELASSIRNGVLSSARRPYTRSSYVRERHATQALSQSLENIDEIVAMYALVNRIGPFASGDVLEAAEAFVKKLVEKYGEQNMSIDQINSVALEQHADPLNDFALKCRAELREVYEGATWRRR
jgi:hypothetical protein